MYTRLLRRKYRFEAYKINNGVLIIFAIVSLLFLLSLALNGMNNSLIIETAGQIPQPPH
jgi:hypothetical protein